MTSISQTTIKMPGFLSLRSKPTPSWPRPEDSIGLSDKGILIDGKTYWLAQGPAVEAYNTIKPAIEQCLNERRADLYEGLKESFIPYSVGCWMVGKKRAKASPYIVIGCLQAIFSQHIMNIIKTSDAWQTFVRAHEGFGKFVLLSNSPARMARTAGSTHVWVYTSDQVQSIRSAPIFFTNEKLDPGSPCSVQQAVLGDVIYIRSRPYGLTVAHPFASGPIDNDPGQQAQPAPTVFYMDESDDDSGSDVSSMASSNQSINHDLESSGDLVPIQRLPLQGSASLLGRIVRHSSGSPNDNLDWALVELLSDEHDFVGALLESARGMPMHLAGERHTTEFPAPRAISDPSDSVKSVLVPTIGNEVKRATLGPSQSLVCLPGSHSHVSLQTLLLSEPLMPGDCGKWVVDDQGTWYGHIVAGTPGSKIAYISTAQDVTTDIEGAFGIEYWHFQDPRDIAQRLSEATRQGHALMVKQLFITAERERKLLRTDKVFHSAAQWGQDNIVRLMLDRGVRVDVEAGQYGTALQAAATASRNVKVVQTLLDAGANPNVQGGKYGTALHAAMSTHRHEGMIQLLLNAGVDVNACVPNFGTVLHIAAAESNNPQLVQQLLDAGANPNVKGGKYCTVLQATIAWCANEDIVKMLLDHEADVNIRGGEYGTSLCAASYLGKDNIVTVLLSAGAELDVKGLGQCTALYMAIKRDHSATARLLIDAGANLNIKCTDNETALQIATKRNNHDIVQRLLTAAASPGSEVDNREAALHIAVSKGESSIARLLIDTGVDVNATSRKGTTILQNAIRSCSAELVQQLIQKGAKVNDASSSSSGSSPLTLAIELNKHRVAEMLIAAGADPNGSSAEGVPPLHIALKGERRLYDREDALITQLLRKGADVNARGLNNETALHIAARHANSNMFQQLLDAGARVNDRTRKGETALHIAIKSGSTSTMLIVQQLLNAGIDVNVREKRTRNEETQSSSFLPTLAAHTKAALGYGTTEVEEEIGPTAMELAKTERRDDIYALLVQHVESGGKGIPNKKPADDDGQPSSSRQNQGAQNDNSGGNNPSSLQPEDRGNSNVPAWSTANFRQMNLSAQPSTTSMPPAAPARMTPETAPEVFANSFPKRFFKRLADAAKKLGGNPTAD